MLTPDQVKTAMRERGETTTQWAAANGYPAWAVYRVLNGVDKCHYGRAHEIAVKLGLKTQSQEAAA
jgi:gp16 family phage-associated protein